MYNNLAEERNEEERNEMEVIFLQDIREKKRTASGIHGMTHGRRPKRPNLKLQEEVKDMEVVRADGVCITIPASWFTKTGAPRKKNLDKYKELLLMKDGK